jgi:hypothetical protein
LDAGQCDAKPREEAGVAARQQGTRYSRGVKRLGLPVQFSSIPICTFVGHPRADLEQRFGPPHAYENDLRAVLAPTVYWALELPDGTQVLLEFAEDQWHPTMLNICASANEPARIALALGLPIGRMQIPEVRTPP